MSSSNTLKRKVVIMGSPSVGKTSLTQQYIAPPTYNDNYFPTIESTSHKLVSFDGDEYDCEIIDSAGQDEYTLFPAKYAVGVHGYLLVYSINSRQSFEMVKTVHDKILDYAGVAKVPCVIVGQKSDLSAADRRVSVAEGEALAKKLGASFVESSARDNKNVGKAFEILLQVMQKEYNPKPEKKKSSWWPFSS
ncbi:P-loop containing nucleoside triphosphate hydrolase protein [Naematelia encephala]|uniref:p-loop containing nucleoside triphosphate hydrolase protein n=1 Tax=Naematelia encephala TaxID=71784 RepID=A0A1Y2ARL7_9TREE|nr:P-loop containing nucleoside triphosphate hydrolase protein [Naematelia encephala]